MQGVFDVDVVLLAGDLAEQDSGVAITLPGVDKLAFGVGHWFALCGHKESPAGRDRQGKASLGDRVPDVIRGGRPGRSADGIGVSPAIEARVSLCHCPAFVVCVFGKDLFLLDGQGLHLEVGVHLLAGLLD